jgi:hypothetical protein
VESDVLYRALRDFNIPKILAQDMVIFSGLLNDLFPGQWAAAGCRRCCCPILCQLPGQLTQAQALRAVASPPPPAYLPTWPTATHPAGVDPPRKRDMDFEDVIRATAVEMGLTPEDDFVLRVVQLSELLAIRHCVFLMGPTGSGRSEAYRVLARAITRGTDRPMNDYLKMTNRKKVRAGWLAGWLAGWMVGLWRSATEELGAAAAVCPGHWTGRLTDRRFGRRRRPPPADRHPRHQPQVDQHAGAVRLRQHGDARVEGRAAVLQHARAGQHPGRQPQVDHAGRRPGRQLDRVHEQCAACWLAGRLLPAACCLLPAGRDR